MADTDTAHGRHRHPLTAAIDRLARAIWLTLQGFLGQRGLESAGALAYSTLLSLVPFLATLGALYRSFFSAHTQSIVNMITMVLPYSSDKVAQTLTQFVDRATTVGGVGSVIFVVVVFELFLVIERSLNGVWGVVARRSLKVRVFSVTMVLFWGPVVIGLGATGLYWLESNVWVPTTVVVVAVGRFLLPLLAFTMMYWLVPNTPLRLTSAFAGGLTATLGLQLLRVGFVAYLRVFPTINFIYGSLALALILLMALFAFWALVLLGAHASYVAQNLEVLLREPASGEGPHPDAETTAMALLGQSYRAIVLGEAPPSLELLVSALGITHRYGKSLLDRLVNAGLLAVTGQDRELYVPARDAESLTVAEALRLFRMDAGGGAPDAPGEVVTRVVELLARAESLERELLERTSFRDLVEGELPA